MAQCKTVTPVLMHWVNTKPRMSKTFILYILSMEAEGYCPSSIMLNWRRPILTSLHKPIKNKLLCGEAEIIFLTLWLCLQMPLHLIVLGHLESQCWPELCSLVLTHRYIHCFSLQYKILWAVLHRVCHLCCAHSYEIYWLTIWQRPGYAVCLFYLGSL